MHLQLSGKVVIVTGGAAGIGEAVARAFAAEEAAVCILDRSADAGAKLAAELGATRAAFFACELTDEAQVRAQVAAVLARFGRIDVLVNNAGVNDGVGLGAPVAEFRASLERNVTHCFVLAQACRDALVAARGAIVNIGTKCSFTGQGGTSGYVAAKGAMAGLTREWALELAPHGVRVNCVVPAEVLTPLYAAWLAKQSGTGASLAQRSRLIPLERRLTKPAEIADTVVFLASPRSSHTTGQFVHVDGGYTHLDRAATTL